MCISLRTGHEPVVHCEIIGQEELSKPGYVTAAQGKQPTDLPRLATARRERSSPCPPPPGAEAPIRERSLRQVCTLLGWRGQRKMWAETVR